MNSMGCISHYMHTLDVRSCTTFTLGTLWDSLWHSWTTLVTPARMWRPGLGWNCVPCTVGDSYCQRDVVHCMYTNVQEEEIISPIVLLETVLQAKKSDIFHQHLLGLVSTEAGFSIFHCHRVTSVRLIITESPFSDLKAKSVNVWSNV